MKENTLITVTRQYGSGGREVASIVAKKLGLRCYDRKIVAMAAENLGEDPSSIDEVVENAYDLPSNNLSILGEFANERIPMFNQMFVEQGKVILHIAKKGSAVFLGRCADYILKDNPNTFSFFIYADDEFREERAKTHYGTHSLKDLDKEAKNRELYYAHFTGKKWGDPQNYDLMINTSKLSLEDAANLIIEFIEAKQKEA